MDIKLVKKEIRSLEVISNLGEEADFELETNIQYSVEAHVALHQCKSEAVITVQDSEHKNHLKIKLDIAAQFDVNNGLNLTDNEEKKTLHIESYKQLEEFISKSLKTVLELFGLNAISMPSIDINAEDIIIVDVASAR